MPTEALIKSTTSELTKAFIGRIELAWGRTFDSIIEKFYDGIHVYLERYQEKFLYTKTFLHRDPVYFYEIYFPLVVSSSKQKVPLTHFKDIFSENQCIAIVGAAGSGKSTSMRHLFLNVIDKGEFEIPLFIELRRITADTTLHAYIENYALSDRVVLTKTAVSKLMDDGKIILFLDGFDEITPEAYAGIVQGLDDLTRRYPNLRVLVTGRPGSRVEALRGFKCYKMEKLSSSDVIKFIERQGIGIELEARILKIVDGISKERKSYITDYLSNPLLLSLFILTCTTTKTLPDRKSAFYKRVVDTLFVEHDSVSKPDYDRRLKSGLSQAKFEQLLQRFSAISYFNSKFDFDKSYIATTLDSIFTKSTDLRADHSFIMRDLVVSIGIWKEDASEYSFSHRSLQEYFAADFISKLETAKKEEVYRKLCTKLKLIQITETENFFSLCQELDEQSYIRFLLLPILKEANDFLKGSSKEAIFAKAVKELCAEVTVGIEPKTKANRRPALSFNAVSWNLKNNSPLTSIVSIYPSVAREFMLGALFEGLVTDLINHYNIGRQIEQPKEMQVPHRGKWQHFSINEQLSDDDLVEVAKRHPKLMEKADLLITHVEGEERKWQKRLSELDYADSCLITDFL